MRRIPGPYTFDRVARTIRTATGAPICFGFAKFGEERSQIAETMRFLVAAANACANLDLEKLEAIAAGDRALGVALEASVRGCADFDITQFTDNCLGNGRRHLAAGSTAPDTTRKG